MRKPIASIYQQQNKWAKLLAHKLQCKFTELPNEISVTSLYGMIWYIVPIKRFILQSIPGSIWVHA